MRNAPARRHHLGRTKCFVTAHHLHRLSTHVWIAALSFQNMHSSRCAVLELKVHAWWLATKDPLTGKRPDFPGEEMGGSLAVLSPPAAPPMPTPPPGAASRRGGANSAAAAPAAAQPARAGRKPSA